MTLARRIAASMLAVASVMLRPGAALAAERPILAELFTSQGCSSCPPADVLLGELAQRPDVLALSFHVDYWDGLGWKDPYSLHLATTRQRRYAAALGSETYTPQLVVDGRSETVGSDRRAVAALLRGQHDDAAEAAIREQDGQFDIRVGGTAAPKDGDEAAILLVTFDPGHKTPVRGGENGGRFLETYNDVRSLRRIGDWHGQPVAVTAAREGSEVGERAAVIVQSEDGTIRALAATAAGAS